jgi:hypothetical protein
MTECQHTDVYIRFGEMWKDTNGSEHTVIYVLCANRACSRYNKTVRVKQTGADTPQTYMPAGMVPFKGIKP